MRLILSLIGALLSGAVLAQTNVSGYISTNTTWTLAGSPYMVTGNALVASGVTLTIEPGVTVKFDSTKVLQIDGELIAIGTAQSRITFTSSHANPVKGSWGRIQFKNSSTDAVFDSTGNYISGSALKYCNVMYGGGLGTAAGSGMVHCDTAAPFIIHCRILHSKTSGVYFLRSENKGIDSSSIRHCAGAGLLYSYPASTDLICRNDSVEDNVGGILSDGANLGDVVIDGCFFVNNSGDYQWLGANYGALTINGSHCVISDNTFISNKDGAIWGWGNFGTLIISNNYFEGNSGCIDADADYSLVNDNVFIANQLLHLNNPGVIQDQNVLIRIDGNRQVLTNNVIDGNYNAPDPGVIYFISLSDFYEIRNNLIQNNISSIIKTRPGNICGNKFHDNSTNIIYLSVGTTGTNYGSIHNNEFLNNGGVNSSVGVILANSSNWIIQYNDFWNNTGTSCVDIRGAVAPQVLHNNFLNPGIPYEITNQVPYGSPNVDAADNYWGNASTAHIDSVVEDFFDNAGVSVVNYLPSLSAPIVVDSSVVCAIACAMTVKGTLTNPSCFGNSNGSINVTATDGVAPITYMWNNGLALEDRSDLTSGNYSLTVLDANGCCVTQAFTITQPDELAVSETTADANCNSACDGAATLAVTGGTQPYLYNWGNGYGYVQDSTGLCLGNYSITVRDDNNCTAVVAVTVGQPTALIATISSVTAHVTCYGSSDGAAKLIASGGTPPYSFLWSDGQTTDAPTGFAAGTYNATVTDFLGCTAYTSINIQEGPLVFVGVIIGLNSAAIEQNYTYSVAASFNYSYNWSVSNGTIVSGQGTNSIEVDWTSTGQGTVQVVAANQGCSDTISKVITLVSATGIAENSGNDFSLYPNPTNSTITLTAGSIHEPATLTIYDAFGKQVWQQQAQENELRKGVSLDLMEMKPGIFFLNVRTSSGNTILKVVRY